MNAQARNPDALRPSQRRVLDALEQAKAHVGAPEREVLQRIIEQRQRIASRDAALAEQRRLRGTQQRPAPRNVSQLVEQTVYSHPLVACGRAVALRHPIATGLALGAGLVLGGPRRLLRLATILLPLALRLARR
ncbi:hypothetical protein D8I35_12365 [Corticibacter populi]|uniref:Uncharacterized protein n=1 Tax=Corticibacter populi TaxID=1550736 RepID=A0A3M6QSD2_9BURK|nr:hypothetical protein [Corticibacter populi]RMX05934.1 hypothetical protein D8I35_12365 [Corticibacter populi]RZS30742.1 hypothetical protein EV687_2934 [Corticibacter populi]